MARTRRRILLGITALAAVITVGACSHAGRAGPLAGGSASSGPGAVGSGGTGSGSRSANSAPSAAVVAAPARLAPVAVRGSADTASTLSVTLDTGSKIRTASLTVAVTGAANVPAKANRADLIAEAVGGEVDRDDRVNGSAATADLLLRVPPASLAGVLTQLSALGTERSRQVSTTDVTTKVADVTSRVASARDAIARLRHLYDSAVKVSDVIDVENQLGAREADLESLEAQQKSLAQQTSMAAIALSLETAPKVVAHHKTAAKPGPKHHGFVGGLIRGWHGFTSAASAVATGVGTALPFAVVVLLLGLAGWFISRRRPNRVPVPASEPDAAG